MNGIPYKDVIAGKGSALHEALTEGRDADAKRIYAETAARYHATVHGLAVPVVVYEEDKWRIESVDSRYDNNGRYKESKNGSV